MMMKINILSKTQIFYKIIFLSNRNSSFIFLLLLLILKLEGFIFTFEVVIPELHHRVVCKVLGK